MSSVTKNNKSSICQFCFNFRLYGDCTKPNIKGIQLTPTKIYNKPMPPSDSYNVHTCPLFTVRNGKEYAPVSNRELADYLQMTTAEVRKLDIKKLNEKLLLINSHCCIIKRQKYIRSF